MWHRLSLDRCLKFHFRKQSIYEAAKSSTNQFSQEPVQFRTTGVQRHHPPLPIDQDRLRYPDDAIVFSEAAYALPVEHAGPGQLAVGQELARRSFVPIDADAQNVEALGMVVVVGLLDVGDLRQAGGAPGGPEADEHYLALVGRPIQLFAVQEHSLEWYGVAQQPMTTGASLHLDSNLRRLVVRGGGEGLSKLFEDRPGRRRLHLLERHQHGQRRLSVIDRQVLALAGDAFAQ